MKTILYIFIFLLSTLTFAQNDKLFEQANTFYNNGKYTEAIDSYEKIIESGQHSAELYYNIANAHYKLNHIAPSIYYYEKALQLAPNDSEIKNNIVFARNMTIDAIDKMPEVGFSVWLKNIANYTTFDSWAKAAVVLMLLFIGLYLVYYFTQTSLRKRLVFIGSIASLLLVFISVALAYHNYNLTQKDQPAIVFAKESVIKNEPNLRSNEAFKLHEGTKVQILETVDNWKKIQLADGKTGWVLSEDIKAL
jgi:tetratricopeptide (TPR) repeat protein